jgi:hypothetical protein
MDINQASEIAKREAWKRNQLSGLGSCSSCTAPPLPLVPTSNFSGAKEWLSEIPWGWIIGTAIVTGAATGYLTYKVTSSLVTSQVALKVSGLGEKRKRRNPRKKRRFKKRIKRKRRKKR